MLYTMSTDYFVQRIQCPREAKQECLLTVRRLVELIFTARQQGLLKMDEMIQDTVRYPDPFLRKAALLVTETAKSENIRKVLYNCILATKHSANYQFLNQVIIAEAMVAFSESESTDYIFNHLVPSYFGIDYERDVVKVYREYKQQLLQEQDGE